jgi:N-methylhydantoinase B
MRKKGELDPVTFEVLRHRVEEIVHEMYYTMAVLSGNPVIFEVGDHEEALLDAGGETVMVSGGIVEWTYSLEAGARYLVEQYEDNPGINEGDQFILNDVYTACVHGMDIQILAPVFWDGKRVAWVVSAGHHMDIGGMTPTSMCPNATEVCQEGLLIPGLKIVEKGVVRKDAEKLFEAMTRTPEFNLLDIRSKIGANNAAIKRIHETIEKWGIETVLTFLDKIKDYSEGMARAKLRELPDGIWSSRHYIESISEPFLMIQVTLTKEEDTLTIDFTGSSPVSKTAQNLSRVGTVSNALCAYLTMLAYDIPWSAGVWRPINWVIPQGTWLNPHGRAAVSFNTPAGAGTVTIGATCDAIGKMLLCSEKYRKDAYSAPMVIGHGGVSGFTREGVPFAVMLMEGIMMGMGALAYRDGVNTGYCVWTPKVQVANIETQEQIFPWLYLYRKELTDSGGPGKFRGGVGHEQALTPWKNPTESLRYMHVGMGDTIRTSTGLAGGYPSSLIPWGIIKNSNVLERLTHGEAVNSLEEIEGVKELGGTFSSCEFKANDVLFEFSAPGGGGFGDPLKRESGLVLQDVKAGYVSFELARDAYGVVIDPEKLEVDVRQTNTLREQIIDQRLSGGKR